MVLGAQGIYVYIYIYIPSPYELPWKGWTPDFVVTNLVSQLPPPKTSLQNQVPADFTTSQLSTKWGGQPFFFKPQAIWKGSISTSQVP